MMTLLSRHSSLAIIRPNLCHYNRQLSQLQGRRCMNGLSSYCKSNFLIVTRRVLVISISLKTDLVEVRKCSDCRYTAASNSAILITTETGGGRQQYEKDTCFLDVIRHS